ncbi:putative capsular polysaccharide synthesis family protein [Metabacillus halosaccharovorans]|uniref:putative capsular polysaccharide synthesis family protein n=1 Tax=Metabacillus halosaccharovorans TaxID=930124 RepID=UPI0020402A03|nr:putative capsular polysaccharide synthesis family protein [Metabacillus halosaccharovorans]MCM3444722.1 putative capsular polysaccharide synthesis family protein [Metabacillus halosaccharovorans]
MNYIDRISKFTVSDDDTKLKVIKELTKSNTLMLKGHGPTTLNILSKLKLLEKNKIMGLISESNESAPKEILGIKVYGVDSVKQIKPDYVITNIDDGINHTEKKFFFGTKVVEMDKLNRCLVGGELHHKLLEISKATELSPIILYHMGKVGSSSFLMSLAKLKSGRAIWYTTKIIDYNNNVFDNINQLFRNTNGYKNKLKIISLVREPVARNISAFFQHLDDTVPNFYDRYYSGKIHMKDLINVFMRTFDQNLAIKWYDTEFKKYLNIDIYQEMFDKEKGYQVISAKNFDLLLLKLESVNNIDNNMISSFLEVDNFILENENIGENKRYTQIYKEFKETIPVTKDYLHKFYNSKYMRHFYSQMEIDNFIYRWKKREV